MFKLAAQVKGTAHDTYYLFAQEEEQQEYDPDVSTGACSEDRDSAASRASFPSGQYLELLLFRITKCSEQVSVCAAVPG